MRSLIVFSTYRQHELSGMDSYLSVTFDQDALVGNKKTHANNVTILVPMKYSLSFKMVYT